VCIDGPKKEEYGDEPQQDAEILFNDIKVKQSHNTSMEVQGKRMYSSYSLTTSALDGS
jgi:hypothetical protein